MAKYMNKLFLPIVVLCTALTLPAARAEQPQATAGLLAAQLPDVDREELVITSYSIHYTKLYDPVKYGTLPVISWCAAKSIRPALSLF